MEITLVIKVHLPKPNVGVQGPISRVITMGSLTG